MILFVRLNIIDVFVEPCLCLLLGCSRVLVKGEVMYGHVCKVEHKKTWSIK